VTQYVPFNLRAWHAGESSYAGLANCNDYAIGVELEGTDFEDFTAAQYDSLIRITNLLIGEYTCLNSDRVVGHSDVAPGRKTDPGPCFDWVRYKSAIAIHCA
jgi:AmpD protein